MILPHVLMAAHCPPTSLTDLGHLLQVLGTFLGLSLFSLGGGNTLLSEYQHLSVDQFCWLTSSQFADLYALAEAAPGPSSMLVGLLGLGAAWPEGPWWALLLPPRFSSSCMPSMRMPRSIDLHMS